MVLARGKWYSCLLWRVFWKIKNKKNKKKKEKKKDLVEKVLLMTREHHCSSLEERDTKTKFKKGIISISTN